MKERKKEKSVALKTSSNDGTEEEDEMAYVTRRSKILSRRTKAFKRRVRPAE